MPKFTDEEARWLIDLRNSPLGDLRLGDPSISLSLCYAFKHADMDQLESGEIFAAVMETGTVLFRSEGEREAAFIEAAQDRAAVALISRLFLPIAMELAAEPAWTALLQQLTTRVADLEMNGPLAMADRMVEALEQIEQLEARMSAFESAAAQAAPHMSEDCDDRPARRPDA
jgi:hypothetical protein